MIKKITKKILNLAKLELKKKANVHCEVKDSSLEFNFENKNKQLLDTIRVSLNNDKKSSEQLTTIIYNIFTRSQRLRYENPARRTKVAKKEILKSLKKTKLEKKLQKEEG